VTGGEPLPVSVPSATSAGEGQSYSTRFEKKARRSGQIEVERRGRTTDALEGSVGVRISRTVHSAITDAVAKSSVSRL
jgi:hypothetical protein